MISGYHQDYLSALIRKNEIYGQKVGRNWLTTEEAVRDYIFKQKIRNNPILIQHILIFFRKNSSFIYALILIALLAAGIFFFNQAYEIRNQAEEIKTPETLQPETNGSLQF